MTADYCLSILLSAFEEQVGESSNHSVGMATTETEAQHEHTPPASSSVPLALTDDATVKTLVLAGRSQQRRVGVSNRRYLCDRDAIERSDHKNSLASDFFLNMLHSAVPFHA